MAVTPDAAERRLPVSTTAATGARGQGIRHVLAALLLAGCVATPSAAPSTPTPATSVPATSIPATTVPGTPGPPLPTKVPAAFEWQRIGLFATNEDLGGIAAAPAGYAVLEYPRTIWASPDGRGWTKSELPFTTSTSNGWDLEAHANAIVGGPDGFIVVGGYDHTPCRTEGGAGGPPPCDRKPIAWTSPDGRTWSSSVGSAIPADGSELPMYSEMVLIWAAAGGWDAAVEARSSVVNQGNTLLHSVDGLSWTRLISPPLPAGAHSAIEVNGHGGMGTATGQRVVWQRQEDGPTSTLWSTEDGTEWSAVPAVDGTHTEMRFALAPNADGQPWLLVGGRYNEGQTLVWWRSDDRVAWRSGPITPTEPLMQALFAVAHLRDGFILLGSQDADSHPGRPTTWLSDDGMTWSTVGEFGLEPPDGPMWLADGPAGLIGVGHRDGGSSTWLGVDRRT